MNDLNRVPSLTLPPDGRQSAAALEIQRGVGRLVAMLGRAPLTEVSLSNGRRADVVALASDGEIWIIEIKSSPEDFRADSKWPEYRDYCDRLFFAVAPNFPVAMLPDDTGLILADRYGGEVVRQAPEHKLAAARRKLMTLQFARISAQRLLRAVDPEILINGLSG